NWCCRRDSSRAARRWMSNSTFSVRGIEMKTLTCLASVVTFGLLAQSAAAPFGSLAFAQGQQDVAITNARVVVGNGTVINSGTIVVRGGKIVSVSAGAANTQGLRTIDAKGMTAMPGFIDAHRHINTGPNEKQQMQALLEAGYT